MFEFHVDRRRYFDIQAENSRQSVIPFIETCFSLPPNARIMEVGCGEGGVLKAFIEKGYTCVGIEIEIGRVLHGKQWMQEEMNEGNMHFITDDIFNVVPEQFDKLFHLIILKDVIEHIADKKTLLQRLKKFLLPNGTILFGFPPWQMPFGGHQQVCRHKYLSKLPWLHLLPRLLYKRIMAYYNESVTDLMDIYDCGLSIEEFEKLMRRSNYRIVRKKHFLVAPIYRYKFGFREREQLKLLSHLPYVRNLFTTAVYYLVTPSVTHVNARKTKIGLKNAMSHSDTVVSE
jgi:SAM-dependent methyltransferase